MPTRAPRRGGGGEKGGGGQQEKERGDAGGHRAGGGGAAWAAAVAALTEQIAAEAIEKIVVDYEPLPAVFDPLEAMREDAPKVHAPASNIYETKVIRKGDADAALAGA